MERFDLRERLIEPHHPEVLLSSDEGRAVLLRLPAGEELQDHEVHERAWLTVVDGELEVDGDGATHGVGPGTLLVFEPKERHAVRAVRDSRLLLVLSPWPGAGRPPGG